MNNNMVTEAEQIILAWVRSRPAQRKHLLEFLGIPIILCDNNGMILDYNIQASLILDLSSDKLYGQNLKEILNEIILPFTSSDSQRKVYKFKNHEGKTELFFINSYTKQEHTMHFLVRADGYTKPEDTLLITEQKYRNLLENAVEGIFIIGVKGFYLVNEHFCQIFGYEMSELLSCDPYKLFPLSEREIMRNYFTRKLEDCVVMHRKAEQVLINSQGDEIICQTSFFSTFYNGEYAIQGHVRDISQVQRYEKQLEATEGVYRKVMENSKENLFVLDESGIIYANKEFCKNIGYKSEELKELKNLSWVALEYRNVFSKLLDSLDTYKPPTHLQCDLLTSQGEKKTFTFTISTIPYKNSLAYIATGKDITLQKQIKRERKIKRRKDSIANRILRIVAESKVSENTFLEVIKLLGKEFPKRGLELCIYENNNVLKVYNLANEVPHVFFLLREDNDEYFDYLETQRVEFKSINPTCDDDFDNHFCVNGFKYLMQLTLTGLDKPFGFFRCAWREDEDAHIDNLILSELMQDISIALESSLYREQIAQITRKAVQDEKSKLLSKFTIIGEMANSIAHEVRNPMTTVRGLAQLLKEEDNTNESYFELMIDEIDRANITITEFLKLATNRLTRKEVVHLESVFDVVINLMYAEASSRGINIVSEYLLKEDVYLYIDKEQIKQALINILQNALEASHMGDTILIKISQEDENVVIEFKDEGTGVEAEYINNIMEPFFTTKDENAGLGLSVSYKIIRDHGGDMIISSGVKEGTLVKVNIPKLSEEIPELLA
ncbi:MAG TPA: PAS domain S-box protein [Syntrophomonadaceae bacterium]|nr:PAS domain S-box protein [Syntrophomonadaceae bacterium]